MKIRTQRGFGAIAAIVIVVILATLSAALVKLSTTQQLTSAQDGLTAKVWQTALTGAEWGLYDALRNGNCPTTRPLNLSALDGFRASVTCTSAQYNQGETVPGTPRVVTIYTIDSLACNSTTGCPDATMAGGVGYIERRRVVMACVVGTQPC